jgi:hypothetical protein
MEKIAIFDTSSGGNPTPPITSSAVSMIYGCYTNSTSQLLSGDSGWCNLMGGGLSAVEAANNEFKGNVFSANYDIVSDLYIAFGSITGGVSADIGIQLFENAVLVQTFSTINTGATEIKQRPFAGFNQFRSGRAYALRFTINTVGVTAVQIMGWSIGVSFNSLP